MKVIVSSRFAVEIVDLVNGWRETIRTTDYDTLYYGITWYGDYMFLAKRELDRNRCMIEVLDQDLEYVDSLYAGSILLNDIHQIVEHDEKLWITSSGINAISIMDLNTEDMWLWHPEPEWTGIDKHHFNSIWFDPTYDGDWVYLVAHNHGGSQVLSYVDVDGRFDRVNCFDAGMGSHNVYKLEGSVVTMSSTDGYAVDALLGKVYNLVNNKYPRGVAIQVGNYPYFIVGRSEHITDREDRHRERLGAIQVYKGIPGTFGHSLESVIELHHGMVFEVRGLDFHDYAHNGKVWTGRHGYYGRDNFQ